MISTSSILDLVIGLSGRQSNSAFTGAFMLTTTIATFLFSRWKHFSFTFCDFLFFLYCVCIAISIGKNGWPADIKEVALLVLTLAAYPAGRLFSGEGIKPSFFLVTSTIVLIGSIAAVYTLSQQWDGNGKIAIFKLGAAATHFLFSLGFLLIAFTCVQLTKRETVIVAALIFLPTLIFALAMVRVTFVAILASLVLAVIVSAPTQRKQVTTVILVVTTAVMLANIVRADKVAPFARDAIDAIFGKKELGKKESSVAEVYAAVDMRWIVALQKQGTIAVKEQQADPVKEQETSARTVLPSCSMSVNTMDTIAVRRFLARDALSLIPEAGLFGIGLDKFLDATCLKDQVHNSLLQATLEFGWVAGAVLALLIASAAWRLLPFAREEFEARFFLCCLTYVSLLSMVGGRTSRDALLFLFAGLAAGFSHSGSPAASVRSSIVIGSRS